MGCTVSSDSTLWATRVRAALDRANLLSSQALYGLGLVPISQSPKLSQLPFHLPCSFPRESILLLFAEIAGSCGKLCFRVGVVSPASLAAGPNFTCSLPGGGLTMMILGR